MSLSIKSPAFEMNGLIPPRFTCDGDNISPALIFSGIPVGTKSLALTMEDPDVPRENFVWDHWVLWNMPPTLSGIDEGSTSQGVIGINSGGEAAYAGPCPPDREHRYIFTLYALDSLLELPPGSTKDELVQALSTHIIEQAQLIGRYNRN